ncbi:DUF1983 domain-containing protein [Aeromonas media]|uniref:phage tail tip fiber protein n=1 Tax=Aeromonas media TaxID=651 RepID=UPI00148AF45C|nr:DUF1983 domain-containing protein [Aeromonas media]QJT27543.1 DUF1983 domain-containing protein [Aeromonas media]
MAEMTFAAWVALASTAVSVVSMAISLSAMGNKPSFDQGDQGALANRKGKDDPRLVAFGSCLVPGSMVYKNVNDFDKKWIVHNYSLGHGPLKAINQVYIDEQPIFGGSQDRSEQWLTANNEGFGNVSVGIRRGNLSNQTWPKIIENGDGQWTADMRGDGIASLQFLIERPDTRGQRDQSDRVMATSFGASALVEGIKVIDPRVDQLLLAASDPSQRVWMNGTKEAYRNPVLQLLTYLLDVEYGLGLKPKMVNLNTFINSANWCEQNSFYGDGYVSQNDTFMNIINNFSTAFGGNIYIENGQICVVPDTVGPVVTTIKEDDLIGNITVTNDRTGYANLIKVEFQNKDSQFNKDTFIIPANSLTDPTILADGKVFEKNLDCPMSTNVEYIKRFANRELKREKYCRKEACFTISNLDKTLKINDVFVIENSLYELDANTKWRVVKIESELGDKVLQSKVTAQQYDARVYDTSSYLDGNTSGDLGRPNHVILPVTDLQFVQNQTTDIGSGMLAFTTQYQGNQRFRIQYRLSESSSWTQYGEYPWESVMIVGLQTGKDYDFRVQCAATIGSSAWTTITNKRVNKSITLPAVKNLAGNFTSPDAVFTWDAINEIIENNSVVANTYTNLSELVHYYEVQILHGVVTKKTYRATTPRFVYSFDENSKNGANRDVTAKITAISIYGDRGATTEIRVRNSPMAAPSGVSIKTQLINLTVEWLNPSSLVSDYSATDIWITDSKTTAPTSLNLVASSSVGFWSALQDAKKSGWIWLAHRDVFGHESIPVYSAPVFFKQTTIDEELSDSEFGSNIETIENNLTQAQADITKAKTDILSNASEINTVKSTVTAQGVQISNVQTVANSNTGKIASLDTELSATEKDLNAKITTNQNAIVTTNQAMTSMDTRLTSAVGSNTSAIQQQGIAISNVDSALSLYKQENIAEVNGIKSSVTTLSQAQVTTDGKVSSMYGLRVDANGKVAGMTLNANNNSTSIDFLADTFRIASSTTGTPTTCFETRGGQVMMRNALIGNLTASQINAGAINGNHIAATSIIQAGSGATSATLNGADANWRIYAGSATPASAPFRVSTTGALVATNATITGSITATSGSFSGAITASSGAISGRLTMNGGFIDGRSGQDSINLGGGSFRVDNNGNLYLITHD